MRVTLIYPSMGGRIQAAQMEPLTMAALAGLVPPAVSLSFYDDRIECLPMAEPTDLVGISVQSFTAKRAYEIAAEFRRRRVPVVAGGFHVAARPEEAAAHADAIVIGEAEELWPRVINDAREGRLQPVYQKAGRSSLGGLTYRRDIFKGKRYLPWSLVEFGRGCPHACTFCSVASHFGHRRICRPVPEVVAEIRSLPRKRILFVDDNLIGDAPQAKELFRALVPLRVRWIGQAGLELAWDDELLSLAVRSGCEGLLLGFESITEASLRQMRKAVPNLQWVREAIRRIHGHGIKICASFVLGWDYDTAETIKHTLEFANENKFLLALFNHLTPFPGTALYEELSVQHRLQPEAWWLSPGIRWGDVVFAPKNFSREVLSQGCKMNRREFYRLSNVLRRVSRGVNRRAFWTSLVVNLLVRREVHEKQGFLLGHAQLSDLPPDPLRLGELSTKI